MPVDPETDDLHRNDRYLSTSVIGFHPARQPGSGVWDVFNIVATGNSELVGSCFAETERISKLMPIQRVVTM